MSLFKGKFVDSSENSKTIKVGAVFNGDKIEPKWFVWEERKYQVREINYYWLDRQGREKLHCFSVTDGTNNYELAYNTERTVWKLLKTF
jgi:hypothetical protein